MLIFFSMDLQMNKKFKTNNNYIFLKFLVIIIGAILIIGYFIIVLRILFLNS
tara:strand:- start:1784 stop:1939 length:156 start_codon:yes stop_codon:yes gene_type:complete